jgi:cytochrome P450
MPSTALSTTPAPRPRIPGWPWSHLLRMRADPLGLMAEGARYGADVVRLSFGTIPAYVLYAPDVVHHAMVPGDTVWKGTRGSKLLRRILGPGLLTTEALVWRDRRRRAQARFRHEALAGMPAATQRHADRLVADWQGTLQNGAGEVDAMAGLSRLALSVVCEVLFGIDPGEDAARVHDALDEVLSGFLWMMTFPVEGVDRWPLPASLRHRAAVRDLHAVVERLVARRRALGPLEGDLLADWIRAADEGALSPEDLRAEVVTMLLAGHETTANAMSFTLALLATHPEEQAKVAAGLAVDDLVPLQNAFNEGLRLYPPAWVLARAVSADLDLGGTVAKPGSFLFVPIAAIHRDPRWWTDPDTFRPDRHLALSPAARAAFLPFGVGPRRCIGEHFARTEARIALATVLRAFDITADAVPDANPTVTLRPRGPVTLRLRARAAG